MTEAFGQWCILELFGHRRLSGYVTEEEHFGAKMLRIDIPSGCTGTAADWCPRCGDCTCKDRDGEQAAACPLHGGENRHVEAATTQYYGGAAIYAITPTTEEIARSFAANNRPAPVTRWDLERPALPAGARNVAPDGSYELDDDDPPF